MMTGDLTITRTIDRKSVWWPRKPSTKRAKREARPSPPDA